MPAAGGSGTLRRMHLPGSRSARVVTSVVAVVALLLAGCGNDDEGDEQSIVAYCELSRTLNEADREPTEEELDQLVQLAPDEIQDEVATLVQAVESGDFDDPEIAEADQALSSFEEEHCGADTADTGADEDPAAVDDDVETPAVVTIALPVDGATVSNPVLIEPVVVGAEIAPAGESGPGQGHYHVMIDTACAPIGEVIPADESHVHYGDGSTTLELPELEPGEHTLCVQLGDANHQAFGASSTITLTVEEA